MQHLPLFADLARRAVVVVGGGVVAERRVTLLLEAKAAVTVVAPELSPRLAELSAEGAFTHVAKTYAGDPLDAYWLVVAATDDQTEANPSACDRPSSLTHGFHWQAHLSHPHARGRGVGSTQLDLPRQRSDPGTSGSHC